MLSYCAPGTLILLDFTTKLCFFFKFFNMIHCHFFFIFLLCSEGRSRQMAFIGFRSEQEAQEAIKYLHNSYLDTFRISVEVLSLKELLIDSCFLHLCGGFESNLDSCFQLIRLFASRRNNERYM